MNERLVHWIVERMRERDWNQSDVARASGLSRQSISHYMTQRSKEPDYDSLQKLAKGFNVPVDELYRVIGVLPLLAGSRSQGRGGQAQSPGTGRPRTRRRYPFPPLEA